MPDLSAKPTVSAPAKGRFWKLTVGSIGVVFGDIGTSPLYAMREALTHSGSGGAVRLSANTGQVNSNAS